MIRLEGAARTDVGRVRSVNQDAALADGALGVFAVADGMGGHRGGEVASVEALAAVSEGVTAIPLPSGEVLADLVRVANGRVHRRAAGDPELAGMGTTIVAIALVGDPSEPSLAIAHVGDSRAYRLDPSGGFAQVTDDHSLVAEMVRTGRLSAEEAESHPRRNILTRALGVEATVLVDVVEEPVVPGRRYLLCSDGLFNEVPDARVAEVLRTVSDAEEAASVLVDLANAAGSRDNVTCVVVDVIGDGSVPTGRTEIRPTSVRPSPPLPDAGPPPPATPITAVRPAGRGGPVGLVVAGVVAVVVVLGVAWAAVRWYATSAWSVVVDDGVVVVEQGRPGGVLWFDPEVVERTDIRVEALTPADRTKVEEGFTADSLAEARSFVAQLSTSGSGSASSAGVGSR